jgi:hypothetical protein
MKYKLIYQLGFLLFVSQLAHAQKFAIDIIQDTLVDQVNGEVQISRAPFKIEVTLEGLEGVYLYASFKDTIYRLKATDSIPGFADLPGMAMAEESFNKDKELIINDDGWAYWFYDKQQDWHRFDKDVSFIGNKTIGRKSVKQFYFGETKKAMKVKDISTPLYLFFVAATQGLNFNLYKEIQRFKLKINWK